MLQEISSADHDGNRTVVCSYCSYTRITHWPLEQIHHDCEAERLVRLGVGTQLFNILQERHIESTSSCACKQMLVQMNLWGIDGCQEHREEILEHLQQAYKTADTGTKLTALGSTMLRGGPFTLEGLLNLALDRAKAVASQGCG